MTPAARGTLLGDLAASRGAILRGLALFLALAGVYALFPLWAARLVDLVAGGGGGSLALHVAAGALLSALASALAYARDLDLTAAAARVAERFRTRLFSAAVRMPCRTALARPAGELVSRLTNDIGLLEETLTRVLLLPPNALLFAGLLLGMLAFSPTLTLLLLAVFPVMGLALAAVHRRTRQATSRRQDRLLALTGQLEEALSGARELRSLAFGEEAGRRFAASAALARESTVSEARLTLLHPATVSVVSTLGVALALLAAQRLRRGEALSRDQLVGFLTCLGLSSHHLQESARLLAHASRLGALLNRLTGELAPAAAPLPELPPTRGELVFDDVGFEGVLEGVRLRIAPGEIVALSGPSGAGKSTLLEIAAGLLAPTSGRVLLDGFPIAGHDGASVASRIALMPQEPVLFEGSLLWNLRLGRPEATEDEVRSACRAASADAFISARAGGYRSRVGPRGAGLSAGERQRLALARALLRSPQVLLLDEPGSALDVETEDAVLQALVALDPRPAVLVAAHRPRALERADRVVRLEGGRLT